MAKVWLVLVPGAMVWTGGACTPTSTDSSQTSTLASGLKVCMHMDPATGGTTDWYPDDKALANQSL
jgi:hypothetical protein